MNVFKDQGLRLSRDAALNYSGELLPWMENVCRSLNIQLNSVSDLNACYKNLTNNYKGDDFVKSTELYFVDNSTFVPVSVHWNQFLNPRNYNLGIGFILKFK